MGRISVHQLKQYKAEGRRFAMITAYDYPMARLVEQAGIPIILVGDSLGSVVLGYESTVPVTMDDILYHTRAVVRATSKAIVVADMPFMSYQANADDAMRNAGRLLQEGGATAVKLEGGSHVAPLVRRMVESGIPVMGHLGLTPQSVNQFGGHKVQGKTPAAAAKLLNDAGLIAIVSLVAPEEAVRQRAADVISRERFLLVHLTAAPETLAARQAADGEESTPEPVQYETPPNPDLVLKTDQLSTSECVGQIAELLFARGVLAH